MIGNPTSDNGRGAHVKERVFAQLEQLASSQGFSVINLTGSSYEQSALQATTRQDEYDHLVVVGGDGMVSLGVNVIRDSGKPLGIVAVGSGNDFSRSLGLPLNRTDVAVEGIIAAIAQRSYLEIDMGVLTHGAPTYDSKGPDASSGVQLPQETDYPHYFAGMLSCGIDASINERANHSRLPSGTLRYLTAVLIELTRMKSYGYHVTSELPDGEIDERDIVSPLLTIANSRHVGGGIELSPYSLPTDGLLDMVWLERLPTLAEIMHALPNLYNGKLLDLHILGWQRVRSIEITPSTQGVQPPLFMADGERAGTSPAHVGVVPRALRVLVPPAARDHALMRTDKYIQQLILRDGRA